MNGYQQDLKIMQKVYAGITKNLNSKSWKCIVDDCKDFAINSHLLQKNGILDLISENEHVIEVKGVDSYQMDHVKPTVSFKRLSVNKALSLKLFCNEHDTKIFKSAETFPINLEEYKNQLLFTYRTVCSEIRKKEYVTKFCERIVNSNTLTGIIEKWPYKHHIKETQTGIQYLLIYKRLIEKELDGAAKEFVFKVVKYPLIKVYCSALFNIYETRKTPIEEIPLKYVFIHIVPSIDGLTIITGYNSRFTKDSIIDFVNSWENLPMNELEIKLTELFATRIENWGMSPEIYRNIDNNTRDYFIKYYERKMNDIEGQKVDFNLFEGGNYGNSDT